MRLVLLLAFACGKGEPLPTPTIEVMGKRLVFQGAAAHGTHAAVSTGKLDCTGALGPQHTEVILAHGELGWTLGGSLFSQIHTAKDDTTKDAKLEVVGKTVELGGKITIGTQDIVLAGKIAAIVCQPD